MDQKTSDNEVVYHSFNKDDDNLKPTQKEENKKSNFNSEMDNNVSTHRKYSLVELDENNNVKRIIHDDVNTEILKPN